MTSPGSLTSVSRRCLQGMDVVVMDAETVTAVAGSLRAMLAEVDAGRMEASERMRARITDGAGGRPRW